MQKTGFAVRLVSYSASDEHRLLVRLHVVNQVSSLRDILKHLKGGSAENNARVTKLLNPRGESARTRSSAPIRVHLRLARRLTRRRRRLQQAKGKGAQRRQIN